MNGKHVTPRTTGVHFVPSGKLGKGKTIQRSMGAIAHYVDPSEANKPVRPPVAGVTYLPPAILAGSDGKGASIKDAKSAAYTSRAIERASLPLPDGSLPSSELVSALVAPVSAEHQAMLASYNKLKAMAKTRTEEETKEMRRLKTALSRAGLLASASYARVQAGESIEQAQARISETNARRLAERVVSTTTAKDALDRAILLTAIYQRESAYQAWKRNERADVPDTDSFVRDLIAHITDASMLLVQPDDAGLSLKEHSLQTRIDACKANDAMLPLLESELADVRAKLALLTPTLTPVSEITGGVKVTAILQRYSRESPPSSVGGNTARHAPSDYAKRLLSAVRKYRQLGELRTGKMLSHDGKRTMISSRAYPGKVSPAIVTPFGVARPMFASGSKSWKDSGGNLSDPYSQVAANVSSNVVGHIFALSSHVNATGVAFSPIMRKTEDGEAQGYPCDDAGKVRPYSVSVADQSRAQAERDEKRLAFIRASMAQRCDAIERAKPGIPEQPASPSKGLESSQHDDLAPHRVAPSVLHSMFPAR